MKASETSIKSSGNSVQSQGQASKIQNEKPHFKPAQDDTKPPFQDPVTCLSLLYFPFCMLGLVYLCGRCSVFVLFCFVLMVDT